MLRLCARTLVWVAAGTIGLLGLAAAESTTAARLVVNGNVAHELSLSVEDLKQLPMLRLDDVRLVREAGSASAAAEVTRRYAGCLVRDVLDRAQPVEKHRLDLRKSIVTATDGYRPVFSWAELYLSPIGDGVLVVYERDGRPLPDDEGPLALVSLEDTRQGRGT